MILCCYWVRSVCLSHGSCHCPSTPHLASSWITASVSQATLYFLPDEWPLLSAILKILLKTQRSGDTRALTSAASAAPSSLLAPAPPPCLSSHGRILRITQFTPLKASNQWAVKPYWSESQCQMEEGKDWIKNRKCHQKQGGHYAHRPQLFNETV